MSDRDTKWRNVVAMMRQQHSQDMQNATMKQQAALSQRAQNALGGSQPNAFRQQGYSRGAARRAQAQRELSQYIFSCQESVKETHIWNLRDPWVLRGDPVVGLEHKFDTLTYLVSIKARVWNHNTGEHRILAMGREITEEFLIDATDLAWVAARTVERLVRQMDEAMGELEQPWLPMDFAEEWDGETVAYL